MTKNVKGNCTQSQNNGKQEYDAPIKIECKEDLKYYKITQKDCVHLHIGGVETINVYMYKTDNRQMADDFWKEINVEHHRNCRSTRCLVPGTQKPLIVCPECNKCSHCPYGRTTEDRQPRVINYDFTVEEPMINEGYSGLNEAEYELMYDDIIVAMNKVDPLIAQVFELKSGNGLSAAEIAEELGITCRQVYYYLKKVQDIGQKYFDL